MKDQIEFISEIISDLPWALGNNSKKGSVKVIPDLRIGKSPICSKARVVGLKGATGEAAVAEEVCEGISLVEYTARMLDRGLISCLN